MDLIGYSIGSRGQLTISGSAGCVLPLWRYHIDWASVIGFSSQYAANIAGYTWSEAGGVVTVDDGVTPQQFTFSPAPGEIEWLIIRSTGPVKVTQLIGDTIDPAGYPIAGKVDLSDYTGGASHLFVMSPGVAAPITEAVVNDLISAALVSINATLATHGTEIVDLGDVLTTMGDTVTTLVSDAATALATAQAAENTADTAMSNITAINIALSSLQPAMSAAQAAITALQSDLASVTADVTALQATSVDHETRIAALETP